MPLVMEISVTNVAVAFGVCLVLTWLWSMLNWVLLRPKRLERFLRKQRIRGSHYRIFHGDLKEMEAMRAHARSKPMPTLSHDICHRFARSTIVSLSNMVCLPRQNDNIGKNCLMWDGPIPMVNIGEVELVREIFAKYNEFQKPRTNPIANMLTRGLANYEGEKWVHHRKVMNPVFHMEKLKLMLPAFYTSCSEMVNLLEEKLSKSEQEIDINDYIRTMSADSIARAAFGSSYEEGKQAFQLIRKQIILVDEITQSVYFPGLRFLPTKKNRKMRAIGREINNILTSIIEKKKLEERELKDGLLGLLIESNLQKRNNKSNNNKKKKKVRITNQEMIDECKLFYLAGQETPSVLIIWTMILLSKHRDWQSRAREEILNAFGNKKPDFEGLNHLKTINMILHEVLRLYPPVLDLQRRVLEDNTKLGDLMLPSGCTINLPIQCIHQDCEIWGDDAKEFNPERFAQGISRASKGGMSFLAFGWGPRVCIGSNFAMFEAKIALSMILQRFEFELSPSYAHAPSSYGLLYPHFGAPLFFHRL